MLAWNLILHCLPVLLLVSENYALTRVSYWDLHKTQELRSVIVDALADEGILAIQNIPGFKQVRRNALTKVGEITSKQHETVTTKVLPDGTKRRTLATEFAAGQAREKFSAKISSESDDKMEELDTLQAAVDEVAGRVSVALDSALQVNHPFFHDRAFQSTSGKSGESWDSFGDIMHGGSFLEHVHSYASDAAKPADAPSALQYHTDAGLFILFTPALYSDDVHDRQEKPADFRFKDRRGNEHAIIVQQTSGNAAADTVTQRGALTVHTVGPDTVILMVGQGSEQYLNAHLDKTSSGGRALRAVPHSLTVTNAGQRNWYGRMYLPPSNAWLEEQQSTYSALRRQLVEQAATSVREGSSTSAVDLAMPVGCGLGLPYQHSAAAAASSAGSSAGTSRHLRSLYFADKVMETCNDGEIYCWAQCTPIAPYNLTCPTSEVTCVDSNGDETDPSLHISTNHPGCVGTAYVDPGGFCQGTGVNMYMSGFVSYVTGKYRTDGGSTTPACMVLWFEDWKLDSQGKFAAACIGCLLLGIWTESLTILRRFARNATRAHPALLQTFVMSLLYAVQLMFGYFCMLVAMTYQVELFVCIVAGLGMGHGLFHFQPAQVLPGGKPNETEKILRAAAELDEVVDPCCQYLALDDDSQHSQPSAKAQPVNGNSSPKNGAPGNVTSGSRTANPMY